MQTVQYAPVVSRPVYFSLARPRAHRPDGAAPVVKSRGIWLWLLLGAVILTLGAIVAFTIDCSVAQWFRECHKLKNLRYLRDLASISEIFGRAECPLLV